MWKVPTSATARKNYKVTLTMEALSIAETSVLQEPQGVTCQRTAFYHNLVISMDETAKPTTASLFR
jgi:hypothetical protein